LVIRSVVDRVQVLALGPIEFLRLVLILVVVLVIYDQGGDLVIRVIEDFFIDLESVDDGKVGRLDCRVLISPAARGSGKMLFKGGRQGLERDTRINAHAQNATSAAESM
jgi:hypothetical protein